ncbi:MAG: GNAT family N-acetyltransferase [Bacteroidota bacterium]
MIFKTLEGTDDRLILEAFNDAFSDYFVPFHLTLGQLQSKIKADHVAPHLSVGVFENDQLIAFILHGIDTSGNQKVLYNGGTGVIPSRRGQGLTKRMHDFLIPSLTEQHIDLLTLEVITTNIQAIRSYEKVGYERDRLLACYKGDVMISLGNNPIEIKELREYDWPVLQSFWDIAPTWQNSKRTLNGLKRTNKSLAAYWEGRCVGYVIYDASSKRIQQIAVAPNFRRRKVATTLVAALTATFGNSLSIINVDKYSPPINSFLQYLGLENYLDQYEMTLKLAHSE